MSRYSRQRSVPDDLALRKYVPSPTLNRFHRSNAFFRGIRGPVGCLPKGTEYLTPNGWREISQWAGELVGQVDIETGKLEFVPPDKFFALPATEWVTLANRTSFKLTMSEEHRLPVAHRIGETFSEFIPVRADELAKLRGQRKVLSSYSVEGITPPEALIRYAVAVNAEAYLEPPGEGQQVATFRVHKRRKADRLIGLLNQLGLKYSHREYDTKKGHSYIKIRVPNSPYYSKTYDTPWWWAFSSEAFRAVISELEFWGGCRKGPDETAIVTITTRPRDVGLLQHAAAATDYRASVRYNWGGHPAHKSQAIMTFLARASQKRDIFFRKGSVTATIEPAVPGEYKYCFAMPKQYFVIRQNGTVLVSHNSGKSVGCCMELFSRSLEQAPDDQGVRRTLMVAVRNTFPQLISTTIKTWQEWVPPNICPVSFQAPISGKIDLPLADGTRLQMEINFLALDRPEDTDKLKSLEPTMIWFNEASELDYSIIEVASTRLGRFPPLNADKTGGPTFIGLIADTNPPDDDNWWYTLAEKTKPEGYEFFTQPPALYKVPGSKPPIYLDNDGTHGLSRAENVDNIKIGFQYWRNMLPGKDDDFIKVFILGEYGTVKYGKPVYPEYSDTIHLSPTPLALFKGSPLVMGWDFGLDVSCVFGQMGPMGQVRVLAELIGQNTGVQRFCREVVKPFIVKNYPEMPIVGIGDPAGSQRSQSTEMTCYQILAEEGFEVEMAPTNEFVARREAVSWFLTRMVDKHPGFILDPRCEMLRAGFNGKYHFRKMRLGNSASNRYTEIPEKDKYSHPHDALQYLCQYFRQGYSGEGQVSGGIFPTGLRRREIKTQSNLFWT